MQNLTRKQARFIKCQAEPYVRCQLRWGLSIAISNINGFGTAGNTVKVEESSLSRWIVCAQKGRIGASDAFYIYFVDGNGTIMHIAGGLDPRRIHVCGSIVKYVAHRLLIRVHGVYTSRNDQEFFNNMTDRLSIAESIAAIYMSCMIMHGYGKRN
jgi:hypothetical protein